MRQWLRRRFRCFRPKSGFKWNELCSYYGDVVFVTDERIDHCGQIEVRFIKPPQERLWVSPHKLELIEGD